MLPGKEVERDRFSEEGVFRTNNERSKSVLGVEYKDLERSIVDTVKSFEASECWNWGSRHTAVYAQ